jgi:hypothetical protein
MVTISASYTIPRDSIAAYLDVHAFPSLIGRDAGWIEDIWQYLHYAHQEPR